LQIIYNKNAYETRLVLIQMQVIFM
jgi:hypothetical protein